MTPVIDIHVHINPIEKFKPHAIGLIKKGRVDFDDVLLYCEKPAEFLKYLDASGVERAGLINYVSQEVIGFGHDVNDWSARYASADPKRLIAFGGVDPRFVADPAKEVERMKKIGIRAIKIHPSHQLLAPNAYRDGLGSLGLVYERAQALHMPIMIHTGTSIFQGARNLYAQPLLVDDVGIDYPELVVILAHGGRPLWMEEAFFLVRRHKNMYMDISSIPPQKLLEYFPRIEEIADKVLFGTDWPSPGVSTIRGNIDKFCSLPISEAAQRKILYDNAAHLFPV